VKIYSDSAGHLGPRVLRRFLEAVVAISSELELHLVLLRVVEAAVDLVDARYGALGVLDEDRLELAEFITVGLGDDTRLTIGELPKGLGLLGSVIRDSRPLRLADLHEHADTVGFPDGHPPMTSFLGVPITIRGEVFGNLYLTDKVTGEVFTDGDEELALGLASAAAVAIDNARLFEQSRRREAVLAAMHEVAGALVGGVDPTQGLELVARHARDLARADVATIALPLADGETLVIDVAEGLLADQLRGQRFPRAGTVSGAVLQSGEMIIVDDASADHRIGQPQVGAGGVGPALWAPLVAGGQPFGTLSVARSKDGLPFTPPDIEVVRSFAAQASVILEHDQARQTLERVSDLEKGERIARDLHDTVIQRLFAIGMSLQASVRIVAEPAARERIVRSIDELDVTIRQIRTVIFGLEEPSAHGASGLRSQTLRLARETGRLLGFEPQVSFNGAVDSIVPDAIAIELLATLREALANVARHAVAGEVKVSLGVKDKQVRLRVEDDGLGFDPAAPGAGHGLKNMRARAESRGGRFAAGPSRDGGTALSWQVPLPEAGRPD
jgi:two-component system sensor histidine kinase DevS